MKSFSIRVIYCRSAADNSLSVSLTSAAHECYKAAKKLLNYLQMSYNCFGEGELLKAGLPRVEQ